MAWMRGALLAASMAGWLHQLTGMTVGEDILAGHGVRGGKAMIATLRWLLIAVPGRLVRHAGRLILRLPPGRQLLAEVLARLRARPRGPDHPARDGPTRNPEPANPARQPGDSACTRAEKTPLKISNVPEDQLRALLADSGLSEPSRVNCHHAWVPDRSKAFASWLWPDSGGAPNGPLAITPSSLTW